MVYKFTKLEVLRDLRIKIIKQESRYKIAKIAENLLQERIRDEDPAFEQFLIDLTCMQSGLEYELSYEELEDKLDIFYMGDDFVYDRLEFAKELRRLVHQKASVKILADWAYDTWFYKNKRENKTIHDIAYALSFMCCDEGFEYSYEELEDIADKLIAGEDVKL